MVDDCRCGVCECCAQPKLKQSESEDQKEMKIFRQIEWNTRRENERILWSTGTQSKRHLFSTHSVECLCICVCVCASAMFLICILLSFVGCSSVAIINFRLANKISCV